MKTLIIVIASSFALTGGALAIEQPMLARVTVYWHNGKSGQRACWNGAGLRAGHCAVDPRKVPYGSKVIFPDAECLAVDSGPDVVNRKAARLCGRTVSEREAIVIDRFFETKREAFAWSQSHPHFMTVRIITPEPQSKRDRRLARLTRPPCDLRQMFDS
jgi:3D (Asp-Asp-Asp) domain-containing protein